MNNNKVNLAALLFSAERCLHEAHRLAASELRYDEHLAWYYAEKAMYEYLKQVVGRCSDARIVRLAALVLIESVLDMEKRSLLEVMDNSEKATALDKYSVVRYALHDADLIHMC